MNKRFITTAVSVGAACAVVGSGLGITSGMAASDGSATTTAAAGTAPAVAGMRGGPGGHGHGPGGGGMRGGMHGGIHSESVVADPDGSGFVTITSDSGTLTKVDGKTLTLKQGTATETYDTVDITAKGTVTVVRNGAASTLDRLAAGDHVRVSVDGTNTRVHASTAAWEASTASRRPAAPSWPKV